MPQASPKGAGEPARAPGIEQQPRPGGVRLRVVKRPPRKRGVKIRIKKPRLRRGRIRLRITPPQLGFGWFPLRVRRFDVALLMAPAELSIAVSRAGGPGADAQRLSMRLPARAIVSAVQAGNVREPDVVVFSLKQLWHQTEVPKRRVGTVTLIIPDQCVRMIAVPLDGKGPDAAEGDAIARWALRDILPLDVDAYRVDWTILAEGVAAGGEARRWLFATAAQTELVREYEVPMERIGMSVGRVVPASLAVAASSEPEHATAPDSGRLVLCGMGRRPAAIIEVGGVPRMHRAWRAQPSDMAAELRAIDAYARQRLEVNLVEALIAGPPRWSASVAELCDEIGWETVSTSRWSAHRGATK